MGVILADLTTGLIENGGVHRVESERIEADLSYPDDGLNRLYQVEEDSYWFKHRNSCFGHLVEKYSRGGVFLDVGGGNGVVSKALQDKGSQIVLVEPDPSGCRNAAKRGVRNIFSGTLGDLPLREEAEISSIGAFDVIEHIEDDFGALEEMHSFLSDDGHLFVSVPAFNFLWSEEDVHAGHFRRYPKKSLADLVQRAGFEVVETGYLFSVLYIPILILRSIPSFLGLFRIKNGSVNRDHGANGGLISGFISRRLKSEFARLKRGSSKMFGSSVYLVARKSS